MPHSPISRAKAILSVTVIALQSDARALPKETVLELLSAVSDELEKGEKDPGALQLDIDVARIRAT